MDEGESYEIVIGKDSYALKGMKKIVDEQILSNPKDIDITFEDLLILVNLILAKDMMSVSLWLDKPNFLTWILGTLMTRLATLHRVPHIFQSVC